MKIKEFNHVNLKELRANIEQALQQIGTEYGVAFVVGGGTFSPDKFSCKIEAVVPPVEGMSAAETEFRRVAPLYGAHPDDFGRVVNCIGKPYTLCGVKIRGRYAFVGRGVNGSLYKLTQREVLKALGREVPVGV